MLFRGQISHPRDNPNLTSSSSFCVSVGGRLENFNIHGSLNPYGPFPRRAFAFDETSWARLPGLMDTLDEEGARVSIVAGDGTVVG